MTNHPNTQTGKSQASKILRLLQSRPGLWVRMPELSEYSGAYAVHSRVSDLRKAGHIIEQRLTRQGRKTESFYRLV
jgi:hypothetical protein